MWFLSKLRRCIGRGDNRGKDFFKALEVYLSLGVHTPPALVPEAGVTGASVC